jgi:hypothetical protein
MTNKQRKKSVTPRYATSKLHITLPSISTASGYFLVMEKRMDMLKVKQVIPCPYFSGSGLADLVVLATEQGCGLHPIDWSCHHLWLQCGFARLGPELLP